MSCVLACLPVLCLFRFGSHLQERSGDHVSASEENMRGEKKINGDVNQVDEERNRRASIFLAINPLKIDTSRFGSIATR